MVFSSIPFLYYFLPAVLILYAIAAKPWKNTVLLLSSLTFYGWGEPRHLWIMLVSILSAWFFAIRIEKSGPSKAARFYLAAAAVTSLAPLLYFKYANFALDNFRALTGLPVPVLAVTLPVGISFYTFQILSYAVDVYRGDAASQPNIIKLGTYFTMFPQLVAGPIVRYTDVEADLSERKHSYASSALGLRRFILGLAKKILIANRLGILVEVMRGSQMPSVLSSWLYAIAFTLQIYFDFSAYSDMAIGLGHIFGFHFPENFNYPFISQSISEFWRRWHISLGSWFRDYIYIPLGGNRVPKHLWLRNIVVVWLLTGLWHGAAWNFVLWGAYFIVFLLLEKIWLQDILKRHRLLAHGYTLFFVIISMVIFNASSLSDIGSSLAAMFGLANLPFGSAELLYHFKSYAFTLVIAIFGSTPITRDYINRLRENEIAASVLNIIEPAYLAILLLVSTAYLVDGSFNPFLYFRF